MTVNTRKDLDFHSRGVVLIKLIKTLLSALKPDGVVAGWSGITIVGER